MIGSRLLIAARGGASLSPPPGPPATLGQSLTKQGVVIGLGGSGTWNEALIESPAVWSDPNTGKYHMVAVGYEAGPDNAAIGVFTADTPDGPWTAYGSNPFYGGSGSGADSAGVSGPFVRVEGTTYYLYTIGLTSGGYEGGTKSMCVAVSSDWVPGTNSGTWTRHKGIITPTSGWRDSAIWHPNVVKVGSTYYNFFNANGATEEIGYATSSDQITWTVDDANSPIIGVGSGWESGHVGDPCVYFLNGIPWMAYYGAGSGGASDGLAYTDMAHFPLGPSGGDWTKIGGNPVLTTGASYDSTYAHKPFILIDESLRRYYHWYTAVGSSGRVIALATEDY